MSAADRTPATEWPRADSAVLYSRFLARRDVAVADLFLPAEGRLRDDDRATIARLLSELVDGIEQRLRRHLATAFADRPMLAESLGSSRIAIAAPILDRAGALRDAPLIATLAWRAGEARLVARLRLARDRAAVLEPEPVSPPLAELVEDGDMAIAAAAARLTIAGDERRDPAGAPVLVAAELSAEAQHRLVWRCAAAVRDYIIASHAVPAGRVDPVIARAAAAVLAGYDEGETLAELALALARALAAAGRLDDVIVARALASGEAGLFCAALAVRAAVAFDAAWEMLGDPSRLLLLCRAAGVAPSVAADCALRLAAGEADDELIAGRLDAYAALAPERASAALALWRLDPVYIDAIADLAGGAPR